MIQESRMYADLHNHTPASDGALTPVELVQEAVRSGIRMIAVTDHDTIDSLQETLSAGREAGIDVMPGMEITIQFKRTLFTGSLHLLAYFDSALLDIPAFIEETDLVLSQGRGDALTEARIRTINECFGPESTEPWLPEPLRVEHVYRHGHRISRRHFALALNDLGIHDRAVVSSIIGNDSPAYLPSGIPLERAAIYLRRWPLVRILAHPAAGSFPGESHYREVLPPFEIVEKILPEFIGIGLDGLEIEYPGHTEEWKKRLREWMYDHHLYIESGGSDCHDRTLRPPARTGVTERVADALRQLCAERIADFSIPTDEL
ncbi:PHP domain-containing protein [bacterium]|nr:PHP domain-containing protein [candidate division CSSED10-310 bacterium]